LLAPLDSTYGDRLPRSRAVAAFLLRHFADYDRTVKADGDSIYGGYIELERWSALAFFDPDVAAEQLAEAVRRSAERAPTAARIRVAGLASTLATPLARHQKLLAYAAGIEALQAGAARLAHETLESLGDAELTVGGVTLPSARVVLRSRAMAPETSPRNPDAPATESRRADDEARKPQIFISYHHLNLRWADWFKTAIQHSSPNGIQVGVWVDGGIMPGVVWTEFVIARLIEEADAAMVLLTADYLTSEHCMHELSAILERVDRGEMELSWVLLSACDWVNTPVARYAAANRNASLPLDKLPESEQRTAVASIADDLVRRVLRRQTAAKTGHHGTIYLSAPTTAEAARLEVAIESQGFRLLRAPHDEAAHAAGSGLVERLGELHEEVSPRVERMAEWLTKALAFLCVVDQEGGAGVDSPARARPLQESEYVAARTAGIPIYVFMPTSERGERQGGGVGEPTGIKE